MLELLSLPDIVLEKILSYLTYDDIARYRIVRIIGYIRGFLFQYDLHPLPLCSVTIIRQPHSKIS
jgi:hypothetical protein